jgi:hypothetical protein
VPVLTSIARSSRALRARLSRRSPPSRATRSRSSRSPTGRGIRRGDHLGQLRVQDGSRRVLAEVRRQPVRAEVQHQFNPTTSGADGDPQLLLPASIDVPVYSTDTLNVQVNGTASDNADVVLQLYYERFRARGSGSRRGSRSGQHRPLHRRRGDGDAGNDGLAGYGRGDQRERRPLPGGHGLRAARLHRQPAGDVLPPARAGHGVLQHPASGPLEQRITGDWFITSGKNRNRAHIPVINANNKATTFLDGLSSTNVGAVKLSLTWGSSGRGSRVSVDVSDKQELFSGRGLTDWFSVTSPAAGANASFTVGGRNVAGAARVGGAGDGDDGRERREPAARARLHRRPLVTRVRNAATVLSRRTRRRPVFQWDQAHTIRVADGHAGFRAARGRDPHAGMDGTTHA